uniref:Peroxiredoxin-like 2A n=1 Tax=Neogobius melanostomus TaxID=47308 RepID=A0A8C6WYG9_9GOBI
MIKIKDYMLKIKAASGDKGPRPWRSPPFEAADLSSLGPLLQDLEVPLFAVVKENIGKKLDAFKKYFTGEVYVDQQEFLRPCPVVNVPLRAPVGYKGNLRGEAWSLEECLSLGRGILMEHREKEFRDKVNMLVVLTTIRKIKCKST